MHPVDLVSFIIYMINLLGFGLYFIKRNEADDLIKQESDEPESVVQPEPEYENA